eukprot:TRINITY_DN2751_c0_g1_i1.p1 TRINITY_DN2751_c0_g1~~TRINITY_DN2751_c0_g1_i1.p1  ORF type:complete len:242 (+),score=42.80 TRINITY_DN2751_c0_g1_i1:129-854(+)
MLCLSIQELLQQTTGQIRGNIEKITKLINHIGTNRDSEDIRQQINDLARRTRELATVASEHLHTIDMTSPIYKSIVRDFQHVIGEFSETMTLAAQREKAHPLQRHQSSSHGARISSYGATSYQDDETSYNKEHQFRQLTIDHQSGLIEERNVGIRQLEKDITEINSLFISVAEIVREQGQMVETLEENIERTYKDTEQANVQLIQANKSQKKSRTKLCCILLIVTLLLVVVVILLWFFLKK